MTCKECNTNVSADNNFCTKCGAALSEGSNHSWVAFYLCLVILLMLGAIVFLARAGSPQAQGVGAASILKDLVPEKPLPSSSAPPAVESAGCDVGTNLPAGGQTGSLPKSRDHELTQEGLADLQRQLETERLQRGQEESSCAANTARLRAEADAIRQELAKTQEDLRKANFANSPTAAREVPPADVPNPYSGPTRGEIVWQGHVNGYQLVEIRDGVASPGRVTSGSLPGVACFVQPSDPRKVVISDGPRPANGFRRLVFRVKGNGSLTVRFTWVIQK